MSRRLPARWVWLSLALVASAVVGCSPPEHVLVVHSPLDTDVLLWAEEGFESAHPDVDVRWMQVTSQETLRILRDRKTEERPDVWWGAPPWVLAIAAREGLLAPAPPSWQTGVPDFARDPETRWIGVALDPLVMALDRDQVSLGRAPRDWIDVFHPRWQGEVVVPDAPGTVAGSLLVGTLVGRDVAAGGDGSAGFDWLRRLDGTVGDYVGTEAEAADRLRRGQATIGVLRLSAARVAQARDSSVAYRLPESGTPVLVEGVAVPAGATDMAVAGSFVEWLGASAPAMEGAQRFGRMPARQDLEAEARPAWLVEVDGLLRPWVASPDAVAEGLDAWVERWATEIRATSSRVF